jgi:hypothetical protein
MFGFYCKLHDGMQPIGNIHSMRDEIERLQELLITSLADMNRRRGWLPSSNGGNKHRDPHHARCSRNDGLCADRFRRFT